MVSKVYWARESEMGRGCGVWKTSESSGQKEVFSDLLVFGEDPIQALGARGLKNHREVNLVDVWVRACSLILTVIYRRAARENQQ